MCGIVAYKGKHNCLPFLLNGLSKLEYRGYDSAGVCLLSKDGMKVIKSVGKIESLKGIVPHNLSGLTGIGHTRWATHGKPCIENCHPVVVWNNRMSLVHNGIIENYESIKQSLRYKNKLIGDTDSEVLLYAIYEKYEQSGDLLGSFREICSIVTGAFAIVLMGESGQIMIARKGSPIVIGYDDGDCFVSSDSLALSEHCKKIVYAPDNSVCDLTNGLDKFLDFNSSQIVTYEIEDLRFDDSDANTGGFDHFMLKEIYEQPDSIDMCLRGRIDGVGQIKLGGFVGYEDIFNKASGITIVACGSSYHAGILGKYMIEELCGIKTSVEHASEFKYRVNNSIGGNDIVIGISQSGETADTISALQEAKIKGATIVGVTNVIGSSLARLTECGIHIRAGREIGVASTKAFTNQIVSLMLLSLWIEQNSSVKFITKEYRIKIIEALKKVSCSIDRFLQSGGDDIKNISEYVAGKNNCVFLGRGAGYPIALEGALKLKELSYIYAEGFAAGEMKHGPIALIDDSSVVVALLSNVEQNSKMLVNINEIKSRGANVISIGDDIGDVKVYDHVYIDTIMNIVSPLLSVVPLQLLAYYVALYKGYDVDKPRNLAKSVTVE